MTAMLSVQGLRVRYGEIEVIHGVDLAVGHGEVALGGPARELARSDLVRQAYLGV